VRRFKGQQPKRKSTYCFTGVAGGNDFGVYNNSINALERGVKERVLMICVDNTWVRPFRPSEQDFASCIGSFSKKFKRNVKFTTPMTPVAYAMTFRSRKQTRYLNASKLNETYGFNDKFADLSTFMKHEKLLFETYLKVSKDPAPRIIQPRDDRYLVETGRYIKPIEKLIYKNIDDIFGSHTVFKTYNMQQRGNMLHEKWLKYMHPVALGVDASKFDRHVSSSALKWEAGNYSYYYPCDKYLKRLMKLQRNNTGRARAADGRLKYTNKHGRASGDSNTSCGNVLIMCGIIYGYFESVGLKADLINDGDDCVIICEKSDMYKFDQLANWFYRAGFIIVIEPPVYVFEQIEFCQSQPVFDSDGGYTMVRKPRLSISKDAVALKPLDNLFIKRMWMAAIGDGGLALTSGIPVLQEYYSMYKRNSCGAKPLHDPTMDGGFFRLSMGMKRSITPPSDQSRLSFWLAFGITPQEQLALESHYSNTTLTTGNFLDRFAILPL